MIFSHSSARAIGGHPRNVPTTSSSCSRERRRGDGQFRPRRSFDAVWQAGANRSAEEARLKAIHRASKAEVEAGLKAWDAEHPVPVVTVANVADHIEHVVKVAGYDHVGIGGDMDGIDSTPRA